MNPCPVVDGGRVLLFCINAHKTEHGRHRHLLLQSDDDGATWSEPRDVTGEVGEDRFVPGPGVSVRTSSGRLVVPGYSNEFTENRKRIASYARAVFSDDGGQTWQLGEHTGYAMSNESQAAELGDGTLVLNWRIQKGDPGHPGCRGTSLSLDGGATWGEPQLAPALNALPCQAGLIRATAPDGGAGLLFTNPDARPGEGNARTHMTVKVSRDDGATWPVARLIDAGRAAYSCPAVLRDGTIAVLYEAGDETPYERLRLARFTWDWLEGAADD
jgi:sialidase-1